MSVFIFRMSGIPCFQIIQLLKVCRLDLNVFYLYMHV